MPLANCHTLLIFLITVNGIPVTTTTASTTTIANNLWLAPTVAGIVAGLVLLGAVVAVITVVCCVSNDGYTIGCEIVTAYFAITQVTGNTELINGHYMFI